MKALLFATCAVAALGAAPALAADESAPQLPPDEAAPATLVDVVVITARRAPAAVLQTERPESRPYEGPDVSGLLTRVPGAARVGNGALSGQVQYRGLFGSRLNMRIDGHPVTSGGPNLMDPPLHYAPSPLVAALEVDRGVSPVREGPGLGGGVNVRFKQVGFETGTEVLPAWDLTLQGRSADGGRSLGGVAGLANERWRFNILGAWESGDDFRFPGGDAPATRYERAVWGLSGGLRLADQELGLDLRRQATGATGNPAFAMDIRYFDTDTARLAWRGDWDGVRLEAALGATRVDHAMNNYDLRPAPAPMQRRESFAQADTDTAELGATFDLAGGALRLGADLEQGRRKVRITNPTAPAFHIDSLPDIETERLGAFAEWTGPLGPLQAELGVRLDSHEARAGRAVTGPGVPAGPTGLAAAFNAADRERGEDTWDAVARLWTEPADGLSWRFVLSRKSRAPGYVERFSWLPTEASGGLADGNIYVGDLTLRPETAWSVEAGVDYVGERLTVRPTVFLREIDDYIQGVPFDATPGVIDSPQEMVSAMNGDPTPLRFANVGARLWGADLNAALQLDARWRAEATASWVRGDRTDIDDALYRIAPPNLTLALTREAEAWSVTLETRMATAQTRVSRSNDEQPTGAWAMASLYGDWQVRPDVRLSAGIENLFDTRYAEHLSGVSRVAGGDLPPGERIPGAGRGLFLRLNWVR